MFDRYIRKVAEKNGYDYILNDVSRLFKDSEYVIGNLEGPVTDFDSVSVDSEPGSPENYVFTMDKEALDALYDLNIKILNIGNNHINNFGEQGLSKTLYYLDLYGLEHFGDVTQIVSLEKTPLIIDKGSYRINIFNYNQFGGKSAEELNFKLNEFPGPENVNIIYAHWGDEYLETAPEYIVRTAEGFVDNGADLIIGSHPHVIQNVDSYKGKKIFYSLGNFVMDQYFEDKVRKGLVVFAEISEAGIDTEVKFIYLDESGKTVPIEN
jgi:poly-gamma-glutamate synthesis protein (capsule biosynthesis protein)